MGALILAVLALLLFCSACRGKGAGAAFGRLGAGLLAIVAILLMGSGGDQ